MSKYICLLVLSSVMVSAECKPGYQSAKVVKVLAVSRGVSAPARADEEVSQPAVRRAYLVILSAGGKQYGLRLPPGSDVSVAAGDEVCLGEEGKTIRVLTQNGKTLPGAVYSIRQMPQLQ